MITMSLEDALKQVQNRLIRAGCDQANATALASTLIAAERDDASSHGLFRLPGYLAALASGKVNGHAKPQVIQIAPSVLRIDGNGGFAPLALEVGRQPLINLTQQQGVVVCGLINIHHFASLWPEVEPLAQAGLCAIAMTSFKPAVAPAGGTRALFGTNPMAFGWPRRNGPPMVFDQASAAMARGEVMLAARDGKPVPVGTGLDAQGRQTQDPKAILDGGVLLPFGGYKGSAIAMMVELMAGALIGEQFSFEAAETDNNDGGPPRGGEFLLTIDPARTGDAAGWLDHSEALFERLLALEGTRLPGDRRYQNRARCESLTLSEETVDLLAAG